jgi:hypothetical protein
MQGLAAGDRIVTSGHYRVQPGAPVEIVDAQGRQTADKRAEDKVD